MNQTPPDDSSPPARQSFLGRLTEREHRQHLVLICILLWSILSFLVISRHVLSAVEVQGRSMETTLHDGDRHVVNRIAYHFRDPRRGEMVVLNDNIDDSLCVKRIVALPGETVLIKGGFVYVDGEKLTEHYLTRATRTYPINHGARPIQVPADHYFVLGDNRSDSVDSRVYGPLPRKNLIGVISQ